MDMSTGGRGNNRNNPVKGSIITVGPIREVRDVKAIKKMLFDRPLYHALFVVGINTSLRASDLLALTVGQVAGLQPGNQVEIREKKTRKKRPVTANRAVCEAIKRLLAVSKHSHDPDARLFQGQRGPLTVSALNRLVKGWCATIRLPGNYGSHTLRKTWAYHQHIDYGVTLPELMECLNHSSQRTTLRYICIRDEKIREIYQNEI